MSPAYAAYPSSTTAYPRVAVKEADRTSLIHALVSQLLSKTECSELARQAYHNRLFSFAIRLLGSTLGPAQGGDASSLVHGMRLRLQQQQREGDAASLDEQFGRLSMSRAFSGRTHYAIMHLLQQLSEGGAGMPVSSIATYQPLQLPIRVDAFNSSSHDQQQPGSTSQGRGQPAHVAPKSHDEQADVQSSSGRTQPQASSLPQSMVKEPSLVKDVLRAAQAITSSHTSFVDVDSMATGRLVVNPAAAKGMHPSQHTILQCLGELGLLYRCVLRHVEAGRSAGSVRQAFSAALQQELSDFYRLMAVLESQLDAPLPCPGEDPAAASGAPYLTLRRLVLWLGEPLRRMRLLAVLAEGSAGQNGGALAGVIWAHTKCGDPLARSYVTRILHQVCIPLFDKIRCWVFEGRLEDPQLEFFIVTQHPTADGAPGSAGMPDAWREGCRIVGPKLPPFLSQSLALRILRAGKTINFLRDACGDAKWVQERAAANQEAAAAVGFGQLEVLEEAVASASAAVDARLVALLYSRFHLARHCDAIRRYLLLGQGDFVVALMDALGPELCKPAAEVSDVTLNHLLRQAVLSSAAKWDDDDTLERLRARKDAAAGSSESGWDVFSLRYDLTAPLSTIFSAPVMAQYQRVFRLLWRLKRVEHGLGGAWTCLKVEIERELPKFRGTGSRSGIDALLRSCLRLRHEMASFATSLQYYIMFEVLEGAWQSFQKSASAAADLDVLLAAHATYLEAVLTKALLDDASAGVRETLTSLLGNMLGLPPLVSRLRELVKAALVWMEDTAARAKRNTAAGKWGTTSAADAARRGEEIAPEDLQELEERLTQLEAAHRAGMTEFTQQLPAQAHNEVRFLLHRLDGTFQFNRRVTGSSDGRASDA